jgi:hypothetical protein
MKDAPAAIFQVIFGGLFLAWALAVPASLPMRVGFFFVLWWSLLFVANSQPAMFHCEDQKVLFRKLKAMEPRFAARSLLALGYIFYWPIFVPKVVCLGLLIVVGLIYYGLRHLGY